MMTFLRRFSRSSSSSGEEVGLKTGTVPARISYECNNGTKCSYWSSAAQERMKMSAAALTAIAMYYE